ncbi:MAG: Cof-type HAD-IIB family hydrolase [Candidatus Wallbacteria bacterium]|nr:Cof-type HAD-IIB family hydrolase [Candidatus Wallbacteria bacterium]
MTFKLIALDLDGTLLDDSHRIRTKTLEKIQSLSRSGIRFVLVTGRMFCSARSYSQLLGTGIHVISYNGALIVDEGQSVFERLIERETCERILRLCDPELLLIFISDRMYVKSYNQLVRSYVERAGVAYNHFLGLNCHRNLPLKFIYAPLEDLEIEESRIRKSLGASAYVTNSLGNFIEIMHPEVSKAEALSWYSRRAGISMDEVLAFGDGMNDLEMLSQAGCGVAMGNAPDALKKAACEVTTSNQQEGVYDFLEKTFRAAACR